MSYSQLIKANSRDRQKRGMRITSLSIAPCGAELCRRQVRDVSPIPSPSLPPSCFFFFFSYASICRLCKCFCSRGSAHCHIFSGLSCKSKDSLVTGRSKLRRDRRAPANGVRNEGLEYGISQRWRPRTCNILSTHFH